MDVFEAVKTMLAVRNYQAQPIPSEVVARIVEAARLTGSSRNRQMWDFVVIQDSARLSQLGKLASSGAYIGQAALAIAVVVPDGLVGSIDGTRAVQDMMLVAWESGIGSNWVGNVNTESIRTLLNVPADQMILTIVPFGYPVKPAGKGLKQRKSLAEVAHQEQYGTPFEG